MPLINDLEIGSFFKDEDREEGDSITDLIIAVVALPRRDINRLVGTVLEALKPIKLWDKG